MIRFARKDDLARIKELWTESFGYDDFAEWYFENIFKLDNTLVYELAYTDESNCKISKTGVLDSNDSKIVAMLQRLPYSIKNFGDVTYIYGACTDSNYRKRGIMGALLSYSETIDIEEGKSAIFLVPENEGLFNFYEKKGYTEHFYKYLREKEENHIFSLEGDSENSVDIVEIDENYNILYTDLSNDKLLKFDKIVDDMLNLYNYVNKNNKCIIRDKTDYYKQISVHINSGGRVFYAYKHNKLVGYTFGYVEDDIYKISEFVVNNDITYNQIINGLNTKFSSIIVLNSINGKIKVKYGCIKLLRKMLNVNKIIINLVFD